MRSDRDDAEARIEPAKIIRVGGDDLLTATSCADHDVGVGDVGGTAGCEQPPDVGGIDAIEGDDVRLRLTDQPGEASLPFRSADRLSQGTCRDGDSGPGLSRAGEQHDHLSIVAIESDEPTGVEGDSRGHAAGRLSCLPVPRIRSAHARSSAVRPPPVWVRASASIAPQPATSSRDTLTACCTKPETLRTFPDPTKPRMRASWSSSRVMVIFFVAIPNTIPSSCCPPLPP